jgi:hypothetical protein
MTAKLKAAAEAIGVSVSDLGLMLVDAGLVDVKPEQGESLSLEALGQRLAVKKSDVPLDQRPEFFSNLTQIQKAALICHLKNRGHSSVTIGVEFDFGANAVTRIYNEYAANIGANVLELRQETVAGIIQLQMEAAIERIRTLPSHAPSNEDDNPDFTYSELDKEKLSWQVFKEGNRMLRDLGIVSDAPRKAEIKVETKTTPSSKDEALRRLEELSAMEAKRKIEIETTHDKPTTD